MTVLGEWECMFWYICEGGGVYGTYMRGVGRRGCEYVGGGHLKFSQICRDRIKVGFYYSVNSVHSVILLISANISL